MKLSTRSRYGVRLMLSLALNYGQGSVYLKDIAKSEEISEKYLGQIIISLRSAGLVISSRGVHGGYNLAREPSAISLKEIIDVLEGGTCLVDCVKNPGACPRVSTCVSRDIWSVLGGKIAETLTTITLDVLVRMKREKAEKSVMQYI